MSLRARGARAAAREGATTVGGGSGDGGSERRRRGAAFAHEGALAMVDDDEGMRGRTLGRSSDGDGWRWEDDSHLRQPAEDFPALGGGGSSGPGPRFAPGVGASAPPIPSAEAAFPALPGGGSSWSAMANSASSSPARVSASRSRPAPRPSPSSSAPVHSLDALLTAPAAPAGTTRGGASAAARGRVRRGRPGPPPLGVCRLRRRGVHPRRVRHRRAHPAGGGDGARAGTSMRRHEHAPHQLGSDASAFARGGAQLGDVRHRVVLVRGGAERRVDYFRSEATGFPSIRLSDAILADRRDGGIGVGSYSGDGSRAPPPRRRRGRTSPEVRTQRGWAPPRVDPWLRGLHRTLLPATLATPRDAFTDFSNLETVTGALREFSGEYALQLAPPGAAAEGASAGPVAGRWSRVTTSSRIFGDARRSTGWWVESGGGA